MLYNIRSCPQRSAPALNTKLCLLIEYGPMASSPPHIFLMLSPDLVCARRGRDEVPLVAQHLPSSFGSRNKFITMTYKRTHQYSPRANATGK